VIWAERELGLWRWIMLLVRWKRLMEVGKVILGLVVVLNIENESRELRLITLR
jgi:hypothetical protein